MSQRPFAFLNDNEIYLILEQRQDKEGTYLFDFASQYYFSAFIDLLDKEEPIDVEGASMVELVNSNKKRRFRDGTYYKLNRTWVRENTQRITRVAHSSVIRFQVNLAETSVDAFFNGSGKPPDLYKLDGYDSEQLKELWQKELFSNGPNPFDQLIVRYVGQGSWNEFYLNNQPKLVFDIGTIYTAPKNEVVSYMRTRDQAYQDASPILILSHWDVDHYQMLLEAENATIQAFKRFIFRNELPNATSFRVLERFLNLNQQALIPVAAEIPKGGKKSSKDVRKITDNSYFHLFNGSQHWNRNLSGMMLSYQNLNVAAVCPADFEYKQIQKSVLQQLNHRHHHYLVVPHHGGEAGKLIYGPLPAITKRAIISVGKDKRYGHPRTEVVEKLRKLGFRVINFQIQFEDYHIPLRRT